MLKHRALTVHEMDNAVADAAAHRALRESEVQDLLYLTEMFPTVPSYILNMVYKKYGGNMEVAARMLLETDIDLKTIFKELHHQSDSPTGQTKQQDYQLESQAGSRHNIQFLTTMFPEVPTNTLNIVMETCEGNVDLAAGLILDINPLETETEPDIQRETLITNRLLEERNDRATDYDFEQATASMIIPGEQPHTDWSTGGSTSAGDANQSKTPCLVNSNANLHLPSTSTSHSQYIDPSLREHMEADWVNDCSDEEDTIPLKLDSESVECLLTLFGDIAFPVPDGMFPTVDLPLSLVRQIGTGGHGMEIDDEGTVDLNLDPEFCRQLQSLTGTKLSPQTGCNDVWPVAVDLPVSLARQIYFYLIESQQRQVERHEARYERIIKDAEFAHRLLEADLSMEMLPETRSAASADRYTQSQDDAEKMTKLITMYPNVNQGWLLNVFQANGDSLDETLEILQTMPLVCSEENVPSPEKLLELEKKTIEEAKKEIMTLHEMRDMMCPDNVKDRAMNDAKYYREEVRMLNNLRDDFFQRMTASSMDMLVYAQVAQHYRERVEEANARAAAAILTANAAGQRSTTLDLHSLRVAEAKVALELFLDHHASQLVDSGKDSVTLFLIVGRGNHSVGRRPVVKPAVQTWLRRMRGMDHVQVNPGMLRVVLKRNDD